MYEPSRPPSRSRRLERRTLHLWTGVLLAMFLLSIADPSLSASAHPGVPIILEVGSAEVCILVERLKPVEPGRRFPAGVGKLYCFSRISNVEKETEVHHVWYRGTEERLRIALPVKPPSWRTYSWKRIQPTDFGEPLGDPGYVIKNESRLLITWGYLPGTPDRMPTFPTIAVAPKLDRSWRGLIVLPGGSLRVVAKMSMHDDQANTVKRPSCPATSATES